MTPLWHVSADQIVRQLQGTDQFGKLINDLISAEARLENIPTTDVHLTVRQEVPDGGVDAAVRARLLNGPSKIFELKTVWQYKARDFSSAFKQPAKWKCPTGETGAMAGLHYEVAKDYSIALIQDGYAYRLCICDSMPAETKSKWTKTLENATKLYNPSSPDPIVVTADDLAPWINRFPSICVKYFWPHLGNIAFQSFEDWGRDATAFVRDFVPVTAWETSMASLAGFCDLGAERPPTAVSAFQGEAGVGKTRLVYEAIRRQPAAIPLVLYTTSQEHAIELAKHLSRSAQSFGIIVADECGLNARVEIEKILQAHRHRARAVCIDNSGERPLSEWGDVVVKRPSQDVLETILATNYAHIAPERRRAFISVSERFIRLAVDLCEQSAMLPMGDDFSRLYDYFHNQYLKSRLRENERRLVEAVALFTKVGCREDVADQLKFVAELCDLTERSALELAAKVKESPGFIAFGGRFMYVTPEIIAQTAFLSAWQRWAEPDITKFLSRLPSQLFESVTKRVERSSHTAIKDTVAGFFVSWAGRLTSDDLGNEAQMRRLVQLVETQPATYLPIARRLVEGTPIERIRELHRGAYWSYRARRPLAWLAEKAGIFPEYFSDVEAIARRLALAETEPELGNNATHIWTLFFSIYLSGTSLPFAERFALLKSYLESEDTPLVQLALSALRGILGYHGSSRFALPPVVFGRIPPEQWRPPSAAVERSCYAAVLKFMIDGRRSTNAVLALGVRDIAIETLRALLNFGFLEEAKAIIGADHVDEQVLPKVREAIDHFFEYDCSRADRIPADFAQRVKDWYHDITPRDFHGRLVAQVGIEPWHLAGTSAAPAWQHALEDLAREAATDPQCLKAHLGWLMSDAAKSAYEFGVALGRADASARYVDVFCKRAIMSKNTILLRGYIAGALGAGADVLPTVQAFLDRAEETAPTVAFEVATSGDGTLEPVQRVIRMVREGKLRIEYLRGLERGTFDISNAQLCEILDLMLNAAEAGDVTATATCLNFLWMFRHTHGKKPNANWLSDAEVMTRIRRALELALRSKNLKDYRWKAVVEAVKEKDADLAIAHTVSALVSDDASLHDEAESILKEAAPTHADKILGFLTGVMGDEHLSARFRLLPHRELLAALPPNSVRRWLDAAGPVGANFLARSLPGPFRGADGKAVMPTITEDVLARFGSNDEMLRDFAAGLHSFQIYSGDIAAQHEAEAKLAEEFLSHPVPAIRKWAAMEIRSSKQQAERARQEHEEDWLV